MCQGDRKSTGLRTGRRLTGQYKVGRSSVIPATLDDRGQGQRRNGEGERGTETGTETGRWGRRRKGGRGLMDKCNKV